jgi:purine catabolism regulator
LSRENMELTEMMCVAVRVADLLKLPTFKLSHTLAGVRGLIREVEYIDVLEHPDIDVLIKPRVLYLTSGFAFHENEQLQETLIAHMEDIGAAGLVVEPGRYLTLLSSQMIEEANRLQFPIVELPQGAVFANIIREGLEQIFLQQSAILRRSQEIQRQLTQVAFSGANLQQISQTIANLMGNTIIVADQNFSLLSFAFWEKEHKNQKRKAYVGRTLDQYLYNLERTGFIDKIRKTKKADRVEVLFSKQGEQAWVVVPVLVNDEILGYIAVLEDYHRMREEDWGALVQAATVTGMAIYKQVVEEEVARRQRNDFLFHVLEGQLPLGQEVVEQAKSLQISLHMTWSIIQIELVNLEEYRRRHFAGSVQEEAASKQRDLAILIDQLTAKQKDLLVACKQEWITVLCPMTVNSHAREQAMQRVEGIKQELQRFAPELEIAVGVSRVCEDYRQLPLAYREAKETLEIGRNLDPLARVYCFWDLGVYQILTKLKDMPELKEYYEAILGRFDHFDTLTRSEFVKTLEAYFNANGNIFKAAQLLYLHRNSMTYRLKRIQDVLGVDLDDSEVRFNLQLALKIRKVFP